MGFNRSNTIPAAPRRLGYNLAGVGLALQGGNPLAGRQAYQTALDGFNRKQAVGKMLSEMGIAGPKRDFLSSLPDAKQTQWVTSEMERRQQAAQHQAAVAQRQAAYSAGTDMIKKYFERPPVQTTADAGGNIDATVQQAQTPQSAAQERMVLAMRDPSVPDQLKKVIADRYQAQYGTPDPVKGVSVGDSLVNPYTGETIYQGQPKTPTSYQEYLKADPTPTPQEYAQWVKGGYTRITPDQASKMGLDQSRQYQVGADGKISQIGGNGVTVNTGDMGKLKDPGAGLVWQRDAGGNVQFDAQGAPIAIPYQGGTAQIKQAEAQVKTAANNAVVNRGAQNVFEDTSRAINLIDKNPELTTGFGSYLSSIPGTDALALQSLIDSVKSNVSIDALLNIKKSGAGLGQVPQSQLELLSNTIGNLSTAQDAPTLKFNLQRVQDIYGGIVKSLGGDPAQIYANKIREFNGAAPVPSSAHQDTPPMTPMPATPDGVPPENWPLLWGAMTPEQRKLFQ